MKQYQYQITTSTIFGLRLLSHIGGDSLQDVKNIINKYNVKYPDWDMQLYNNRPHTSNELMPVTYLEIK